MKSKRPSPFYNLNPSLSADEKLQLLNSVLERLITHFRVKADKSKRSFHIYKYASIILAAMTTIVSSMQVIYADSFPSWILPVASAAATVAVAFLGASGVQKIWIDSRTTQQLLQTELFLFNQNAGMYSKLDKDECIKKFSERMIDLWNEGHGKWKETVGED